MINKRNKFIVVGCGRLGCSIALHASNKGEDVTIFDKEEKNFERLGDSFPGFMETGDASLSSVLTDDILNHTDTLVVSTNEDNVNLFLAMKAAKIFDVPHIYARFNDPNYSQLISGLNIRAVYPFELSFNKVAEMLEEDDI